MYVDVYVSASAIILLLDILLKKRFMLRENIFDRVKLNGKNHFNTWKMIYFELKFFVAGNTPPFPAQNNLFFFLKLLYVCFIYIFISTAKRPFHISPRMHGKVILICLQFIKCLSIFHPFSIFLIGWCFCIVHILRVFPCINWHASSFF